jgi:predicted nucleotidyltransferase
VARIETGAVEPELATLRRMLGACGEELVLGTRALRESPVAESLRAMRATVLERAASRGARNVRVFGSVARGDDRPDSDIDLLVEVPSGRTMMTLAALSAELSELLGRDVDVSSEGVLKPEVRERARSEAVRL